MNAGWVFLWLLGRALHLEYCGFFKFPLDPDTDMPLLGEPLAWRPVAVHCSPYFIQTSATCRYPIWRRRFVALADFRSVAAIKDATRCSKKLFDRTTTAPRPGRIADYLTTLLTMHTARSCVCARLMPTPTTRDRRMWPHNYFPNDQRRVRALYSDGGRQSVARGAITARYFY